MPTATPTNTTVDVTNSTMGCYLNDPWSLLGNCALPQLSSATGGSDALFGLFLGGVLLASAWLADDQGRIALPSVLLILLGGSLLPMLPGNYRGMAWTLIILGLTAGMGVVAHRYVLNPGVRP